MDSDEDRPGVRRGGDAPLPRQRSASLSSWTSRAGGHFAAAGDEDDSDVGSPEFPSVTDLFGPTVAGARDEQDAPPRAHAAVERRRDDVQQGRKHGAAAPAGATQQQEVPPRADTMNGVPAEASSHQPQQQQTQQQQQLLPPPAPGDGYVMVLVSSLRETSAALTELEADVRAARAERCVRQLCLGTALQPGR
jgi:hypothetical protein